MLRRALLLSPRVLLLLLVLLPTGSKTTTVVHAFSPATTTTARQQHQIITTQAIPRPHYANSRLNLFGRSKNQAENNGKGNIDNNNNEGHRNSNSTNHQQREGILPKEVKKLDSFPARAKELRNNRMNKNKEDRHAWKNKNKKNDYNNNKYPLVIEKAIYQWRGLIKKLRYAIHRNTIYVLECEHGKYYVGSTKNPKQRYREHFDESNRRRGSKWTRLHKPIRVIAEYKRIPSRYLMGMESQKTSEWMFEHGVNNVRGAGYCLVREFTTEDLAGLTTFLGHYNQLDYDSLGMELEKVLPRPYVAPAPKPKVKKKKKSRALSPNPNETTLTNKDVAVMAASFNRKKDRNYRTKKRRKERKLAKVRGETKCYKCGQPGHWASECPNEGTSTVNDAGRSSTFANRWESDTVATSYGSMDAAESVSSENKTSVTTALIPSGDITSAADEEHISEIHDISTKTIEEKVPTGQEDAVATSDGSVDAAEFVPFENTSFASAFIPSDDLNSAADEEHLSESHATPGRMIEEKLPSGQKDAVATSDGLVDAAEFMPFENTSFSSAFIPPDDLNPTVDGEHLSESSVVSVKTIEEKLHTGEEDVVVTSDGSMHATESMLSENAISPAPSFIPSGDLDPAADEEHLSGSHATLDKTLGGKLPNGQELANMDLTAEECSQILTNACSTTRKIQLSEWQRSEPWIMAILIRRYDRGIRDLDELNQDCSYYWDSSVDNDTNAAITMGATSEGYIDLRQDLTPSSREVDDFIRSMNKRSSKRNDADSSNSNDETPNSDLVFDFTMKGQERAREALRNEKMALLATEVRQILLDAETPLLKFASGLGIETDAGSTLSKHDDLVAFLSLFSRACALYEQTRIK